jgi:predicted ATPase
MTLDSLVLNNLKKYIDGEITLRQFYGWLISNTSQKESELINRIKSILSDFNYGHMTESNLKNILSGEIKHEK